MKRNLSKGMLTLLVLVVIITFTECSKGKEDSISEDNISLRVGTMYQLKYYCKNTAKWTVDNRSGCKCRKWISDR